MEEEVVRKLVESSAEDAAHIKNLQANMKDRMKIRRQQRKKSKGDSAAAAAASVGVMSYLSNSNHFTFYVVVTP